MGLVSYHNQQLLNLSWANRKYGIDCEIRTLPVGDFLWLLQCRRPEGSVIKEVVLPLVVERKTWMDLGQSIQVLPLTPFDGRSNLIFEQDNRYNDQRLRMKRCYRRGIFDEIVYIIEGSKITAPGNLLRVICQRHL